MPFLEILTRHLSSRPTLFERNQASVDQLGGDWVQTILIDDNHQGVNWANRQLRDYGPDLIGDYIWILDDDDVCIRPTLVEELQAIAAESDPDVIMMRMDHGPRGILPDGDHWGGLPAHGHIGCSAYVVRRSLWQACADAWRDVYYADYEFATALFAQDPAVEWFDVIASRVQQIGLGRSEKECVC